MSQILASSCAHVTPEVPFISRQIQPIPPQNPPHLPRPGAVIEVFLPTCPYIDAAPKPRLRHVRVERIRDLVAEPLNVKEFLAHPYSRFGRFILIGRDARHDSSVWEALDWILPQELRIYHDDGDPTKICSGKNRYQRAYFIEIAHTLEDQGGVVIGLKNYPPAAQWQDDERVSLGSAAPANA